MKDNDLIYVKVWSTVAPCSPPPPAGSGTPRVGWEGGSTEKGVRPHWLWLVHLPMAS